jgi:ABC-type polysaccharide/polyol phosphate export permease
MSAVKSLSLRALDTPAVSLAWTLVRTDFKGRYHGSAAGFLWALLKPFTMFVVLISVFSFLFASDPVYRLNLVIGLFLYEFFGDATKAGLMALHSKGYLLAKAKFSTIVVVVASMANAAITLTVVLVVMLLWASLIGRAPTLEGLALFVTYLLLFGAIILGFALATSVMYLRYRDLNQLWDVAVQAGFFLAPVVYPLRIIPEQYHFLLYFWPPTAIIQFSRMVLVEGSIPTARAHSFLLIEAAVVLSIGLWVFHRRAPRAAELL